MPGDGYTNQIWNTICGKNSDEEMWCSYQKLKKLWFCFDKQKIGYWVNKSLLSHLTLADDLALACAHNHCKRAGQGILFLNYINSIGH